MALVLAIVCRGRAYPGRVSGKCWLQELHQI